MSLSGALFSCCFFVFGPAYGFYAVYKNLDCSLGKPLCFAFGSFCAYAGWFIGWITSLYIFPGYPYPEPNQFIASLFAVPGFITGYLGILLLEKICLEKDGPNRPDVHIMDDTDADESETIA